ncbi:MAG: hypothetical protein NVV57_06940 [Demequina sp.]|nr:hypothetical protein [Demequina sp.]
MVDTSGDGIVRIGGATLAEGYADGDNVAFVKRNGRRWFTTPDVGEWDGERLTIAGRADDVIITGGLKAHPARVERALESLPYIDAAAVAGVPDPEWGTRVVAWVTTPSGLPELEAVRGELATQLEPHELPREVRRVGELPRTEGGKIDRRAMRALARGEE